MRALLGALLLAALVVGEDTPTRLMYARKELREVMPADPGYLLTSEQLAAQNEASIKSASRLAMVDVNVQVVTDTGAPVGGVSVHARHETFDVTSGPKVSGEARGGVNLRLPRGVWRLDLVTDDPKKGRIVFAQVKMSVRAAGVREVVLDSRREVLFRTRKGDLRAAHEVTVATPDFSFFRRIPVVQDRFELWTAGSQAVVLQAIRRPDEEGSGYILRRTSGPGKTTIETDPEKGIEYVFDAKGRRLLVKLWSADPLPYLLDFSTKGPRRVLFFGLPRTVVALDAERGGERYGFFPRPFDLNQPRTFDALGPMKESVGFEQLTDGRYDKAGIRNCIVFRVFLLERNGLLLKWDNRGAYSVGWEQLLDGKVRAKGTTRPPHRVRTAAVDPKQVPKLRYKLHIRGPGENRRVELAAHHQSAVAQGGKVFVRCFPEVFPNAQMWAVAIHDAATAYEQTCPAWRARIDISHSLEMPHPIAGMGGGGGNRGSMWLPERVVYGFTGFFYWTGLHAHELGHVYGYGHGNPEQRRIMQQAGRRAGRRYWSIRRDQYRVPEGNRYRALMEAITRGEMKVEQEFDKEGKLPAILRQTAPGHEAGDGVITPNLEMFGEDAVFAWYVRSVYTAKADAPRRQHAASWSWWLTVKGYSDEEIQIAMVSHTVGESLAWLKRMRGASTVPDFRILAAMEELKQNEKKFVWQRQRDGIRHKWRTMNFGAQQNLVALEQDLKKEHGHRRERVTARILIARELFARRAHDKAEAVLMRALSDAREGGPEQLDAAIAEAAAIWAMH